MIMNELFFLIRFFKRNCIWLQVPVVYTALVFSTFWSSSLEFCFLLFRSSFVSAIGSALGALSVAIARLAILLCFERDAASFHYSFYSTSSKQLLSSSFLVGIPACTRTNSIIA